MLIDFDLEEVLECVQADSAVSIRLLDRTTQQLLLDEARGCTYKEAERYIPQSGVEQRLSICNSFESDGDIQRFKDTFQMLMKEKHAKLRDPPFAAPLTFNDVSVQRYPIGKVGITPHKDLESQIKLVVVVILGGIGRFYTCSDRKRHGLREIPCLPGMAIFMRAPGFRDSDFRPFHYLSDITETRYSLGLRERRAQK